MSGELHQLVYVSRAAVKFNLKMINEISSQAQASNKLNNVSGLLMYRNGYFLQLLEGDMYDVHYTFKKIREDDRHQVTKVIVDKKVSRRLFPSWNMAFRELESLNVDLLDQVTGILENNNNDDDSGHTLQALWTFYGMQK